MNTAKNRIVGAILLLLSLTLIAAGTFGGLAEREGTPLFAAYTRATEGQSDLDAAYAAITAAEESVTRSAKRAADAVSAAEKALEEAQSTAEIEQTGAYGDANAVDLLGQAIAAALESGADIGDIAESYSAVFTADLAQTVEDAETAQSRAAKVCDEAAVAIQTAIDAVIQVNPDAEIANTLSFVAENADSNDDVSGTALLVRRAEICVAQSRLAQQNAETLAADGTAILEAAKNVLSPISFRAKLVMFAHTRFVDLLTYGGVLLVIALALLLFPKWVAKKWKVSLFRQGVLFVAVIAILAAALHYANGEIWDLMRQGVFDTLYMTIPAAIFAYLIGLPLGVLLVITAPGHIRPNATLNSVVGTIVNFLRSIPFIILLVMLFDVTRLVMGTAIGTRAIIFPLFVSAFPYVARVVEGSLNEVDRGMIEAAESMGSTTWQIIRKVLIPEALPSLVNGAAISLTTILAYTAMAGSAGGDGLGKIAITYGLNYREYDIMYISSLLLVALVQIIQIAGGILTRALDHRRK